MWVRLPPGLLYISAESGYHRRMKLYDSLSRRLKEVPGDRPISIYACGVTVYDYCHLGHARSYVVWDVLKRWLKHGSEYTTSRTSRTLTTRLWTGRHKRA